jgi:hypothetical protein
MALALALHAQQARSQAVPGERSLGLALGVLVPTGTFSGVSNPGPSIALVSERRLSEHFSFAAQGAVGFVTSASDGPTATVPWIRAGGRYHLGDFFIGADAGFFFGSDLPDEFDLLPVAGWQSGRFVVSADARLLGDAHWFEIQAGYHLARF